MLFQSGHIDVEGYKIATSARQKYAESALARLRGRKEAYL